MTPDLHDFQKALGGKVERDASGEVLRYHAEGHSKGSPENWLRLNGDGEFYVGSFIEIDALAEKDRVRRLMGLPDWKPGKANGKGRREDDPIVAKYTYETATGDAVLIVNRTRKKSFYQQHPDGHGGWEWGGIPETAKVPFRLPEVIEAIGLGRTVFITEGEKGALSLIERGFCATCSPGGAGKWPKHFAKWFEGANVIVLPDNDEPGRKHDAKVRENLDPVVGSIRTIHLPGLIPGGDVWDFLTSGGDPATIETMREGPPLRIATDVWTMEFTADQLQGMVLPPQRVIVPDLIMAGLTLLVGKPKTRKSWLALDVAAAVARGGFVLDRKCNESDVLVCALEDGPRRLKRRLAKVLGDDRSAWPSRLTFWTQLARLGDGGEDQLRGWLKAHPDAALVVIDTFGLARGMRGRDEDPYSYDYRQGRLLKAVADEFEVAVLAVHHARKAAADDVLESTSGTNGLTGASDAALILASTDGGRLSGRSRDLEDFDFALRFDPRTCRWSLLGDAREVRMSSERKSILDGLRRGAGPMSPTEIALAAGMKVANVKYLLGRMVEQGDVESRGYGRYVAVSETPPHSPHSPHSGDE